MDLLKTQRTPEEVQKIAHFLIRYKHILSDGTLDYLNNPTPMTCDITTTEQNPRIVSTNRPVSPEDREEFTKQISSRLDEGVIEGSHAPWSSNAFLVRKDGKIRMAIDYRQLNKVL